MTTCKNCEYTFEGKFCPNCSQKANTHRFSLAHFGHEAFHAVTHTDKGILFLIKEMFFRPGKVAEEYNAGKRKKYFNPVTFLLIMIALQAFVIAKSGFYDSFNTKMKAFIVQMAKMSKDPKRIAEAEKQGQDLDFKAAKSQQNTKLVTFLFIPVLAFFTWLLFRKSGYNYAENLVFTTLVIAQLTVVFLVFGLTTFLIFPSAVVLIFYLYFLFSWIFSFIAYKQFFKQSWGKTIFKGIAVQVLYMIVVQQVANFLFPYL